MISLKQFDNWVQFDRYNVLCKVKQNFKLAIILNRIMSYGVMAEGTLETPSHNPVK